MEWITIATLVAKYGIPFVEHLIDNVQNNKPVTVAEWASLKAKLEVTGEQLIPLKVTQ